MNTGVSRGWGTPAFITRAGEAKSLAAKTGKRISTAQQLLFCVFLEKRLETKSSPADRFLKNLLVTFDGEGEDGLLLHSLR